MENIHGPVLLISTEADTVWPSAEQAAYIESYLSVHDFSYEVKNLTYKNVSHFTIPMRRNTWLLKLMFRSERQSPEECAAERLVQIRTQGKEDHSRGQSRDHRAGIKRTVLKGLRKNEA